MHKAKLTLRETVGASDFFVGAAFNEDGNPEGRMLVVDVEVKETGTGCRKICLYTKYWLLNKTGLPLSYRMGPTT